MAGGFCQASRRTYSATRVRPPRSHRIRHDPGALLRDVGNRRQDGRSRRSLLAQEDQRVRQRIAPHRSPASFAWTFYQFRAVRWRTHRHLECRRRRQEPAVDRRPPIMSRRGCIGETDQVRRPAVNPNEPASSVENPTFDALCGLVRRPAVTLYCYSIYVMRWSYAEYSGAQP
jgi:hypothetical protein